MSNINISVIIPTKNRQDELNKCLVSLFNQSILPDEVLVIYGGEKPVLNFPPKNLLKIKLIKNQKGVMTHGKNLGLKKAKGEIIFIFDDDVVLDKDYLKETVKVFQDDSKKEVGIVAGSIINAPQKPLRFVERIFLLWGRCYRVLPSGANVINTKGVRSIKEVDWASGCAMAIRYEVARTFRVDEKYDFFGYGLGEDLDYSYRVGKKYKIIFNPRSRLIHSFSPRGRINFFLYGFIYIINREYFVSKNMNSFYNFICFYWSAVGWFLGNIAMAIKSPQRYLPMLIGGLLGLVYLVGRNFRRLIQVK
jgi:GT2 family glycosyltransferase